MQDAVASSLVSILVIAAAAACAARPVPGEAVTDPARISVNAEVDDDIVRVAVGDLSVADDGALQHSLDVEWRGKAAATLDDARFTHHVSGDGGGDLVLAGRGCGVQWDESRQQLLQPCTMDLLIIELAPGETHGYPLRIYPQVGPLRLRPGTYVVVETIGWQAAGDRGELTVTLTYVVE